MISSIKGKTKQIIHNIIIQFGGDIVSFFFPLHIHLGFSVLQGQL